MPKKPTEPEWYLVDGVARVWDGENWLSHKWTEPEGWYEFQGENHFWDGKKWWSDFEAEDEELDEDEDDYEVLVGSNEAVGDVAEELLKVTILIESELNAVQDAFQRNQSNGEKLRDKIAKIKSKGQTVPADVDEEMNSITCLREWHWKYIERYEKFLFEAKSTFVEYDNLKDKSGIFINSKRKKVSQYALDLTLLGQTYASTTGDVFTARYSKLVSGPAIRSEALKLMSERLAAASKARGD